MSSFDVGTAFVRVLPDAAQFRSLLQAEVNAAVAAVRVPPLQAGLVANTSAANAAAAANSEVAAAATGAATATEALAATQNTASGASLKEAQAALTVSRALAAQTAAENRLTAAIAANADASKIQELQARATIATQALSVAQLRQQSVLAGASTLAATGAAGERAAAGLGSAATQSKILQGSIVGLSRITPVAVFGLGVAGSAAIAAGLAFKSAVGSAAAFEQQLNTFQAVTGVSAEELQRVREQAIALGADTSLAAVSAGDAADALTELAKAGISVNDALAASRGVLQLAGAASISAGAAATIVATQLNAFKLSGTEAVRVADLLASASIAAQGEITDFAAAFQQVSSVAKQSGLNIETTTALLTELARAGLQGADAGTSLRTTLLRFIPTTKEAQQFVKALGVEFDKNRTLGEQLPQVIEQYRNALSALNPIQRTTVLNQIFGQDAIRAASIIFDQSTGALERNTLALQESGIAAQLSAAKADGLKGAVAGLQSNLETVGVELGGLVSGPLESFVRGMSDSVIATENFVKSLNDLTVAVAGFPPIKIPFQFVQQATDFVPFGDKLAQLAGLGATAPFSIPAVAINELLKPFAPKPKPIEIAAQGITKGAIEEFIKALKTGNQKAIDEASARIKHEFTGSSSLFAGKLKGVFDLASKQQSIAFDEAFAKAAKDAPGFGDKVRAAVANIIKLTQGSLDRSLSPGDQVVQISESQRFQSPIIEAQLAGNLQAELSADRAVENFLRARLAIAKRGTAAFFVIQKALKAAHDATQQVLNEINTENQKAADQQAKALADKKVADEKQKAAVVAAAKAQIDLQNAILETQLSAAELTASPADNRRVFQLQIQAANEDIARQKKIAAKNKEGSKARIDALIQIQTDLQRINQLRGQIKALAQQGDQGGFTLADLFKEAISQRDTFGSNIGGRTAVLSPQDARADLGRTILQGRDASVQIQGGILSESEKQTLLLQSINDKFSGLGTPSAGLTAASVSQAGNFGGWRAAQEAANNLWGAG